MAADVLDAISELARRQTLTGPRFGTDFPHLLIANGIRQVLPPRVLNKDVEEELESFCKGISRVLYDTLTALGVRAHIGYLSGSTFMATEEFLDDLEDNGFEATAEAEDIHRRVLWDLSCNGYCLFRQTRSCEHKTRGPGHLVRDELMDTSDRFAGEVLFPVVTGSS